MLACPDLMLVLTSALPATIIAPYLASNVNPNDTALQRAASCHLQLQVEARPALYSCTGGTAGGAHACAALARKQASYVQPSVCQKVPPDSLPPLPSNGGKVVGKLRDLPACCRRHHRSRSCTYPTLRPRG